MSNAKFNNKSASAKKPYCKVCHDAGKTEAEYTSHYVRSRPDMNGKTTVTCPVLAATECRYCYKLGHTTKFCPVIEENEKRAKKQKSLAIQAHKAELRAAPKPTAQVASNKYASAFAALAEDSDDEKPMPVVMAPVAKPAVDEFPVLVGLKPVTAQVTKPTVSWAAVAEKPAAPIAKPAPKLEMTVLSRTVSKSWADYSDSDTEEDEDEFVGAPLVRTDSVYNNAPCYARATADDDDW